ncbi:MAG: HAD-IA family hydrolase [Nitrospirales bacterium]|nr:HAD-IA family hydrolase [Nitrospira sp.]MDR4500320.1 HAD-IA family hydrolase [Nitrospirales bacterium]
MAGYQGEFSTESCEMRPSQKLPIVEAVAFDLDGLMVNTEELYTEVGGVMLERRGKRITRELLDHMMGRQSHVALQVMIDWHRLDDTVEQLQNETDEIFSSLLEERLAPMPGLLSLLDKLALHAIPKAVTTSSRRCFVDRVLELLDIRDHFQFFLTAEVIERGKPDPEIYQKAAKQFHVEPERLMVLEDSEIGCRAALAAGAYTVAVPGEHSRNHDFSGVHLVAESLADPSIEQLFIRSSC